MSEWQPIETAPRDGTHVLLFYPAKTGRNSQAAWVRVGFLGDTPHREPTHWTPLPEPPPA